MYKNASGETVPLTLCYVDDDPEDLYIFKNAVEHLVKKVHLFRLGADFLASMQSPPAASIVFVDLNMPCLTGFEIIKFIRNNNAFADIPIIVLSTANNYSAQLACWELGADFYIVKPNSVSELAAALEYAINVDWKTRDHLMEYFVFGKKKPVNAIR